MKPNFALKLSNDGAELLHRQAAGWSSVGAVSFETDDVAEGCDRLVRLAGQIDPAGLRTKVVLPHSEVRFTTIVAPGPTDEARRYQIEAEIERLTPYAIDELAYDWSVEGDHALVVICARETLAEAETFADGYGFNPVSFVAIPEPGQFVGEPWFGETLVAKAHLPPGEKVQRDADPIRMVQARPAQAAAPAPTPASAPAPTPAPAAKPAAAPAAAVAPAASVVSPVARPAAATAAAAAAVPPAMPAAAVRPPLAGAAPNPVPPSAARPPLAGEVAEARRPAAARPLGQPSPAPVPVNSPRALVGDMVRKMGTRLRREQADTASAAAVVAPPPAAPAGETPSVAEPATFSSRRRAAPLESVPGGAPAAAGSNPANPGGRLAVLPKALATPRGEQIAALTARAKGVARAAATRIAELRPKRAAPPEPAPIVPASRPPASDRERSRELEAMTIFGARGNAVATPSMARRGLAVAGGLLLILVAVAVWALYFNSGSGSQIAASGDPAPSTLPQIEPPGALALGEPQTNAATAPLVVPASPPAAGVEPAVAPAPAEAPVVTAEPTPLPAAPPVQAAIEPPPTQAPGTPAQPEAVVALDPDALLDTLVDEARSEALPEEIVVASEPADPAPAEGPGATADTGASAAEPAPTLADAGQGATPVEPQPVQPTALADTARLAGAPAGEAPLAPSTDTADMRLSLPEGIVLPGTTETAFEVPPPPPPFGTTFAFDADGLVEATPEGAVTPSGVTVFARRPAVVPAPAPGRPAAAAEPPAPAEAVAAAPSGEPVAAALQSAITEAVAASTAPAEAAPDEGPEDSPTTESAVAGTEVIYDDTPRADPALSGFRPMPRSERVRQIGEQTAPAPDDQTGLSPAPLGDPEAETALAAAQPDEALDQTAETPPPGGVSLAALRPQRRPTDLAVPAAEPAAPGIDLAGATAEAVAQSPIPGARPSNVEERARQLLAAAAAQPAAAPAPQGAAGARSVEDEDEEGETASSATGPSIPSSASVARQATETGALRLNQINLIGVFGAPNDRRALVRLSSGRVVRVQVGDRLDGGQVSAIGESELRYTSGGRNEVLRIGG